MKRPTVDEYMMALAKVAASRTTCIRRGVGCVLADSKNRVLAIAYNGVASGLPHCNESRHIRLASVSEFPRPEHWENSNALYLARALAEHQDLAERLGGTLRPLPKTEAAAVASTIPRKVSVLAEHLPNACAGHDLPPGQDKCEAIHAEQNALIQCSDPDAIATAYVTLSPCRACLKLLLGTGCRRIVAAEEHVDPEPGQLWSRAGREWVVQRSAG